MSPTKAPLEDLDSRMRVAIYRHLIDRAVAPARSELAEQLGISASEVEASLLRLEAGHAVVLTPGTNNLWMAHPFSAVPTPYPVRTSERTYWANCAWDALAIPSLLGVDSTTTTRCADCGELVTFGVRDGRPLPSDLVVHFLVPPRSFWDNVGFT